MRLLLVLIAMGILLLEFGGSVRTTVATGTPAATPSDSTGTASIEPVKQHVDFDTQLKPIFQSKCMPCHFSGGKMYERLPFDKPATIRKLGTRLFTRIKDEDSRRLIEDFLSQSL
jgi:hypothetical protein